MDERKGRKNGVISALFMIILLSGFIGVAYANRTGSFDFSGTWTISYFQPDCSTAWTQFAQDGSGIGTINISPVVNGGASICIRLSVSGANSADNGENVWLEAQGVSTTTSQPNLLFTISGGSGSGQVVLNDVTFGSLPICGTAPIKATEVTSGTPSTGDFDGHIVDHFLNGGSSGNPCLNCPTVTTTSTATASSTRTLTNTQTVTSTATATATATVTSTATQTQTETSTATQTATATSTATDTATVTATQTATDTATMTVTQTVTSTVTITTTHTTTVTLTGGSGLPASPVGLRPLVVTSASCSVTQTVPVTVTTTIPTTATVTDTTTSPSTVTTTQTTTQPTTITQTNTIPTTATVTTTIPTTTTSTVTGYTTVTSTVTETLMSTVYTSSTVDTDTTITTSISGGCPQGCPNVPEFPVGLLPLLLVAIPLLVLVRNKLIGAPSARFAERSND